LIGWSLAEHMMTELCLDALQMASATRQRSRFVGTTFHSDHGFQYTSDAFCKACTAMGITQSMGSVGDCPFTGYSRGASEEMVSASNSR